MNAPSSKKSSSERRKRNAVIAIFALVGSTLLLFADVAPRRILHIADYEHNFEHNVVAWLRHVTDNDTPVYWHIPKSGGTSMKLYYSCMGLATASQVGVDGHDKDETIEVLENWHGIKNINVDTTTKEGLIRAGKLGLAESGLADVVFTSYPSEAVDIFNPINKGAFFSLFRHPNERTVSLFYFIQIASWQGKTYTPHLKNMKLEDWLRKDRVKCNQGNAMTRLLIGKYKKACVITEEEFQMAKDVLRRKFTIGLMSKMEESVERFDRRFGWYDNEKRQQCFDSHIKVGDNKNPHKEVKEGSEAWKLLTEMNSVDIRLYEYAVKLFELQKDQNRIRGITQQA